RYWARLVVAQRDLVLDLVEIGGDFLEIGLLALADDVDGIRVSVLEQNYEYELLEPQKLLRKYIGRDVTLVRVRRDQNSTKEEEVKAHLLSFNNAPVWQIGGEIVTGMQADHIRFPELPGNLYSRPHAHLGSVNDRKCTVAGLRVAPMSMKWSCFRRRCRSRRDQRQPDRSAEGGHARRA